jgi:hypothetical protein
LGGFESLVKTKRWAQLARDFNYKDAQSARILKTHYENLLYPYLLFESGSIASHMPKKSMVNSSAAESQDESEEPSAVTKPGRKRKNANTASMTSNAKANKENSSSSGGSVENIRCLVCKRGDDEAFMLLCDGCDDSYHTFCLFPPLKEIPKGDWRCPVCVADICKKPTDAYGFEQSPQDYTLNEFGKMANKFKSDYFKKPYHSVGLEECEDEFWRLLSSADDSVVVEYGADLHTIDTGSGFPTRSSKGKLNKQSNADPYVNSPWNLNNLSMLDKSVLSQMNVPISGMKIPWAYVGMCFSCFCWHVEDHWSYSINYLHFGEAKTWYGVSGADAAKFESVMKSSASELFERSPDLLHHLVTIMDPRFLQQNGVPIYKVFQETGEFVITFPRAYHAGFNQGFNFAEAVNFCPADWIPLGRAAIESYKEVKRHTVFSHDELVCKLAAQQDCIDINTAAVIQRELRTVIDFEKAYRKHLLERGVKHGNKLAFELLSDDERTCEYCKTTCFVSAVKCTCRPDKMACLNHMEHLCNSNTSSSSSSSSSSNSFANKSPSKAVNKKQQHQFTVLYRYTMEELGELYLSLKKRTDEYVAWCGKVRKALHIKNGLEIESNSDNDVVEIECGENSSSVNKKRIHLSQLQKLLDQAKTHKYPRYDIAIDSCAASNLEDSLVSRLEKECLLALECSKLCKKFLDLYKSNIKVKSEILVKSESGECEDVNTALAKRLQSRQQQQQQQQQQQKCASRQQHKPTLDELKQLAKSLNRLACDIDERELFLSLVNGAFACETKINTLMTSWSIETSNVTEIASLIEYLDRIDIEFPFMVVEQLKLMRKQASWLHRVNEAVQNQHAATFTLKIMRGLIDEFASENLLAFVGGASNGNSTRNIQTMHRFFGDLQELYSIAHTWDEKAREQLQSK